MFKTGKLHFYSETGTEGGYYALQDSEHITHVIPEFGVFNHRTVYDPEDVFRGGKVTGSYRKDGSDFISSRPGDVSYLNIVWDDGDEDFARLSNTVRVERWNREGTIILRDRDMLTIFQEGLGSLAMWAGIIELEEQDPYAEGSYAPGGIASHYRPMALGLVTPDEWTSWFFDERWAMLERSDLE